MKKMLILGILFLLICACEGCNSTNDKKQVTTDVDISEKPEKAEKPDEIIEEKLSEEENMQLDSLLLSKGGLEAIRKSKPEIDEGAGEDSFLFSYYNNSGTVLIVEEKTGKIKPYQGDAFLYGGLFLSPRFTGYDYEHGVYYMKDGSLCIFDPSSLKLFGIDIFDNEHLLASDIGTPTFLGEIEGKVVYLIYQGNTTAIAMWHSETGLDVFEAKGYMEGSKLIGNKIYYICSDYENNTCSIECYDGEKNETIIKCDSRIYDFCINGDNIYVTKEPRTITKYSMSGEVINEIELFGDYNYLHSSSNNTIYISNGFDLVAVDTDLNNFKWVYKGSEMYTTAKENDLVYVAEGSFLYQFTVNDTGKSVDYYGNMLETHGAVQYQINLSGGELYFINLNDGRKPYKADKDFDNSTLILDESVVEMQVSLEDIYYVPMNGFELWVYHMQTGEKEMIKESAYHIKIEGDYIYYLDPADSNSLNRVHIQTKNTEKLLDAPAEQFVVNNDKVYFQNLMDDNNAYVLELKDKELSKLSDVAVSKLLIKGDDLYCIANIGGTFLLKWDDLFMDWIYFLELDRFGIDTWFEGNRVNQLISLEGSTYLSSKKLDSKPLTGRYTIDNWIYHYCNVWKSTGYLVRCNNETKEIEQVITDSFTDYLIVGDYLIYGNGYGGGYLEVMNLKTGENKLLVDNRYEDYFNISFFTVDKELYYVDDSGNSKIMFYNLDTQEIRTVEGDYTAAYVCGIYNNKLFYWKEGFNSIDLSDGTVSSIAPEIRVEYYIGMLEDQLFYTDSSEGEAILVSLDLTDNSRSEVLRGNIIVRSSRVGTVVYSKKDEENTIREYNVLTGEEKVYEVDATVDYYYDGYNGEMIFRE